MPSVTKFDGTVVEYVEVHDEPIHRRQFDNEYCWIYIAGFRPGETSLWHRHSEDTLYVSLNSVAALNRPTDKEPFVHHASHGDLWWSMCKLRPFVHQVCLLPENLRPSQFYAMEILRPPPVGARSPLSHKSYDLQLSHSRPGLARVYKLRLSPGESTGKHTWGFYGVVISMSDGSVVDNDEAGCDDGNPFKDGNMCKLGSWRWVEGPLTFSIHNVGTTVYEAIVVEWLLTSVVNLKGEGPLNGKL
ncbi:unnamed protein product [Choristocarpus tenellus]